MHKYIAVAVSITLFTLQGFSATPQQRRGGGAGTAAPVAGTKSVSARSATRTAPVTGAPSAVRSATAGRTTVQRGTPANSGTANTVAARAGATQKVIGTGTKVAAAGQNTVVADNCQEKFNGCLDAFCMMENVNGGRCLCSNRNAELDAVLAEIEKLDQQSYSLATVGVEAIETGVSISNLSAPSTTRKKIDTALWNQQTDTDTSDNSDEKNKTGEELYGSAIAICMERMPECKQSETMLRTIYNGKIRGDCAAYENAIKEQRRTAETRLSEAQRAMRTSAYEQLRTANKYDLGQCTVEFKKCMATTAGCGDDFKGCVGIAAAENAKQSVGAKSKMKMYDIKGSATKISIAASSYDALESKKPMCMSITNSCVAVKDQVWDTFLREVAPQIKTAELLAESDLRTSCISNISACFQKACKDTMDPNDPDGSYDMCLSRPETVRSLCKVQIDPCEAAEPLIMDYVYARLASMRVDSCTNEVKQCLQSDDRCGKDYTQCVGLDTDTIIRMCPYDKLTGCQQVYQKEGKDIRGDAVYDELDRMVQGIMLGIDNNMMEFCQNAADEAMIKVCGDTENCNAIATDDHIGTGSLSYGICYYKINGDNAEIDYSQCRTSIDQIQDIELGRVPGSTTGELGPVVPFVSVIDGIMFWEQLNIDVNGNIPSAEEYFKSIDASKMQPSTKEKVAREITKLKSQINTAVAAIESDPTVQFCMTGRRVQGMKDAPVSGEKIARFPELTKQMRNIIATSALNAAKANYYKKYDIAYNQQMKDYITMAERQAKIKGENAKDVRREAARISCVSLADAASLPMSPPPPSGWGMWLVVGVVVAASVAVTVLTLGTGAPLATAAATTTISLTAEMPAITGVAITIPAATITSTATITTTTAASIFAAGSALTATGIATVAAAGVGAAALVGGTIAQATADHSKGGTSAAQRELTGHHELDQWNYKQVIDTSFNWDSLNCHKCVKSTKCIKQSYPLFGMPKCKQWAESTEECSDTQF